MSEDFRPKEPRTVSVLNTNGEPIPRLSAETGEEIVGAIIIDGNGNVLRTMEWPIDYIEKQIKDAKKQGFSEREVARGLADVGDDAHRVVLEEVMAALQRRGF